jgi:hypothetical protein
MSSQASVLTTAARTPDHERSHRVLLTAGYLAAGLLLALLAVYGHDYYFLGPAARPFSPKHAALKPNGSVGLWLGLFGLSLFFIIFLYPLRKRWPWLKSKGSTRHWLNFHVLIGLSAPFVIAFHASFKFRGLAGMAFWIMSAVAISGVIGRYLYAQIPRSLSAAELSLKEVQEQQAEVTEQLAAQRVVPSEALAPIFRLPRAERVQAQPMIVALGWMMALDLHREFNIAGLRLRHGSIRSAIAALGGVLSSGHPELERVIGAARRQARLSKRILFLARSQQVFHLWHVVHRPFSYSFAVLALIHITVVMLFGVR